MHLSKLQWLVIILILSTIYVGGIAMIWISTFELVFKILFSGIVVGMAIYAFYPPKKKE